MKSVFILVDTKMNAIMNVFSSQQLVESAKKELVKRDLEVLRTQLQDEVIKFNVSQVRVKENLDILRLINKIDSIYDTIVIDYDNICPQLRYTWYKMPVDSFTIESSLYSPIVLLNKDKKDLEELVKDV